MPETIYGTIYGMSLCDISTSYKYKPWKVENTENRGYFQQGKQTPIFDIKQLQFLTLQLHPIPEIQWLHF